MESKLRTKTILDVLEISKNINKVNDIDSLLDLLLLGARHITGADAGSIYLVKNNKLSFEYFHNDSFMAKDKTSKKYLYTTQEIEINNDSIAGFSALNKQILNIADVYAIKENVPYTFNRAFDESSLYRTQSVLTVPMIDHDQTVGVMQIINPKNEHGKVRSFSEEDELLIQLLADLAAANIERARMTREVILRMIDIAEMRDPQETGPHVNRVATYAIEIYQHLEHKKNTPEKEIKKTRDILRLTAMLHDVGKVKIKDEILEKTSCLDEDEYNRMKRHTIYGAQLFEKTEIKSDWDKMAGEITLNHHEKWDGTGYPGHIDGIFTTDVPFGPGKKGEEIPLTARIVALADVYDALISRRAYKDPWPEERVLDYIEKEKGKHFDPLIVESFFEIYDVIRAIKEKYPEKLPQESSAWTDTYGCR